jgi:glycine/D-amino acid oxidase-like deaminating enzyme
MSSTSTTIIPPTHARVVIIGGGIIGTSVAYHLAQAGWKDVVLLERDQVTSGTTWHAAGLMVCFGSTSETSTEMRKYTRDLYSRLEAETGQATGFKHTGFVKAVSDLRGGDAIATDVINDLIMHCWFLGISPDPCCNCRL